MNHLNIVAIAVLALSIAPSSHGIRCHECIGAVGPLGAEYPDIAFSVGMLRYPVLEGCSAGRESNNSVECPEGYFCGKDYYEMGYEPEKAGMTVRGCTSLDDDEETLNVCSLDHSSLFFAAKYSNGKQESVNPLELLKASRKNNLSKQKDSEVDNLEVHSCVCDSDDCNLGVGNDIYQKTSNLATGLIERMLGQM